jgi:hypothetical protein
MNNEQQSFLAYWFSGFINGLEQVDEISQDRILRACGLACAESYTSQAFDEARQQSYNMDSFLAQLARKFPEAVYENIDEQNILVHYHDCACDLVRQGWVKSPILCRCSTNNLRQNFEKALGKPVQVKLKSSILGGAEKCSFEVLLLEEKRQE